MRPKGGNSRLPLCQQRLPLCKCCSSSNTDESLIDLSNTQLKIISGVTCFASITIHLNLSHNSIIRIQNLERLVRLQTLSLSHNRITFIENLDKLSQLRELDLSHNRIQILPKSLAANTLLQVLDVSNNEIADKISLSVIARLFHIHTFNISNNPICNDRKNFPSSNSHEPSHPPHLYPPPEILLLSCKNPKPSPRNQYDSNTRKDYPFKLSSPLESPQSFNFNCVELSGVSPMDADTTAASSYTRQKDLTSLKYEEKVLSMHFEGLSSSLLNQTTRLLSEDDDDYQDLVKIIHQQTANMQSALQSKNSLLARVDRLLKLPACDLLPVLEKAMKLLQCEVECDEDVSEFKWASFHPSIEGLQRETALCFERAMSAKQVLVGEYLRVFEQVPSKQSSSSSSSSSHVDLHQILFDSPKIPPFQEVSETTTNEETVYPSVFSFSQRNAKEHIDESEQGKVQQLLTAVEHQQAKLIQLESALLSSINDTKACFGKLDGLNKSEPTEQKQVKQHYHKRITLQSKTAHIEGIFEGSREKTAKCSSLVTSIKDSIKTKQKESTGNAATFLIKSEKPHSYSTYAFTSPQSMRTTQPNNSSLPSSSARDKDRRINSSRSTKLSSERCSISSYSSSDPKMFEAGQPQQQQSDSPFLIHDYMPSFSKQSHKNSSNQLTTSESSSNRTCTYHNHHPSEIEKKASILINDNKRQSSSLTKAPSNNSRSSSSLEKTTTTTTPYQLREKLASSCNRKS